MITEFILGAFKGVLQFLFAFLPDIPSIPESVMNGIQTLLDAVASVTGIISYLYTPTVFVTIFTLLVAVLAFDPVYKFATWLWHKIRG